MKYNVPERQNAVRSTIFNKLNAFLEAEGYQPIQYSANGLAVEVTADEDEDNRPLFVTITTTVANDRDTKRSKAFNPFELRDSYEAEIVIKAKEREAKAAIKAAKIKADEQKRAAKAAEAAAAAKVGEALENA